MCWHDWYILNSMSEDEIHAKVHNIIYGGRDGRVGIRYKEKVCLKCKKYVNDIQHHLEFLKAKKIANEIKEKQRKDRAQQILKELNRIVI